MDYRPRNYTNPKLTCTQPNSYDTVKQKQNSYFCLVSEDPCLSVTKLNKDSTRA